MLQDLLEHILELMVQEMQFMEVTQAQAGKEKLISFSHKILRPPHFSQTAHVQLLSHMLLPMVMQERL
jgi:hypothetical protein